MAVTPTPVQQAEEWFNLVMYESAADFGRQHWIEQIVKRAAIQRAIDTSDTAVLDELIPALIDAPLADYQFTYSNTSGAVENLAHATRAVIPLAFHDLDRLLQLRQDEPLGGVDGIDDWALQHGDLLSLSHFGHLKIDLNAKDADIIASFQTWLSLYRQAVGVAGPKEFYRKDLDAETASWHQSKVLPYFDLKAWALWSRTKLTVPDILDLLFPDDPDGSSKEMLRSIQRKVEQLLTISNALALSMATGD